MAMAENNYSADYDAQQCEQLITIFNKQKQAFANHPYPSYQQRIKHLTALKQALLDNQQALVDALSDDFNCRSADESKMADIMPTIMGINYAIKHLKKWMKPSKRHVGMLFQPAKGYVMYQPLGVVGIITPWNYPIFLALGPLTAALAAGNNAMIKMSEFTPATNKVLKNMLDNLFTPEHVYLIDGGVTVATKFSEQAFDHLFFTGSTQVGKMVMTAAAQNLTPVTLELGGKSPTIILPDMPVADAVSAFILGKCLNAGQTCVAPDYLLCPEDKVIALANACQQQFNKMYPDFEHNQDHTSIINQRQYQRLQQLLETAQAQGAKVMPLADTNDELSAQRKMPLTLVTDVTDDMPIMQQEIFGPILPIVSYQNIEQAIAYINQRPRPLALYILGHDHNLQQEILTQTHAGGVCINDTAVHVAQDDMPFGGIGASGMGHYHGHEGFLTFSKAKSVLHKGKVNTSSLAFPPYGGMIHKLIYKFFMR